MLRSRTGRNGQKGRNVAKGIASDVGLRAAGTLVRGFLREGLEEASFTRADVAARPDVKDVSETLYDKVMKVMVSQGTIKIDGEGENARISLTEDGRIVASSLTEGEV